MFEQFLWAILLTGATVATHTLYSLSLVHMLQRHPMHWVARIGLHTHQVFMLVRSVIALLLLHCLETTFWALYYRYDHGLPDFATALYFSMISYATIGNGDVVLPERMRLVGAMEGMVGTMMAGWSVALIIAVLQNARARSRSSAAAHSGGHTAEG